MKYLKLLLLL